RSAGLTFGNCVVRHEEICPDRQPLEITVVTVGVTGEYDDPAAYADTPGNSGYAAVDNLRGIQQEVACAHDRSDLASCQGDIMCLQRVAAIFAGQEICQISISAAFTVEKACHELGGRREVLVAGRSIDWQGKLTLFKIRGLDQRGEICAVIDVQMREQDSIKLSHMCAGLSEAQRAATTAVD